ncbi:MAG TPA: DUF494 family protein [Ignavibacteriales bacterium]|nr:DUF494 family protein [Ignavibacteriales bacterium]
MIPDKIVPLIVKLIQAKKNNISFSNLEKKLSKESLYSSYELTSAYLLFQEKVKANSKNKKPKNFRVFSDDEIALLGNENIKYLLQLRSYNLIADEDIEFILEKLQTEKLPQITTSIINNFVFFNLFEDKELSFRDILDFYTSPEQTIN